MIKLIPKFPFSTSLPSTSDTHINSNLGPGFNLYTEQPSGGTFHRISAAGHLLYKFTRFKLDPTIILDQDDRFFNQVDNLCIGLGNFRVNISY